MSFLKTKFTLACCIPQMSDGTSLWRAIGPLGALEREDSNLCLYHGTPAGDGKSNWTTADLMLCDAMFLQRPCGPPHLQLAMMAKANGLPIWVDWDDDLTCVPLSNPYHSKFPMPQTQEIVAKIAEMADIITVSTDYLAMKAGSKARVLPNAINDYLFDYSRKPRGKVVTWRGSATHQADLAMVLGALKRVFADERDWKIWFIGDPGWITIEALPPGPQVRFGPRWMEWPNMVKSIAECGSYISIHPLAPNEFNASKSSCVWQEVTCAGSALLGPDLPEFRRPGIVNYTTEGQFEKKLRTMMGEFDAGKLHPKVDESRAYITENLLLSRVNEQRKAILIELASKGQLRSLIRTPDTASPGIDTGVPEMVVDFKEGDRVPARDAEGELVCQ